MKKIMTLTLALTLAVASSHALAASEKCTIAAVKDDVITLNCGAKADSFKLGDEVKIRTAKTQKKAIEGC